MASIVRLPIDKRNKGKRPKSKQPLRAIDYVDGKSRKRIHLGIVTHDDAEEAKRRIEKLLATKRLNLSPDNQTVEWLAGIGDDLHEKLAKHGLCQSRVRKDLAPKLGDFIAKYLTQRESELKPESIERMQTSCDKLLAHFGPDIRLDELTPDTAKDWRAALAAKGLAEATVRLHCRNVKAVFNDATERELIRRNPFSALKSAAIAADRSRFVTAEECKTILDSCPNLQWRLLFGLCRFAGLRCSSETHGVTWGNVDWDRRRLTVYAPKTSTTRIVPIVPALFVILEEAYFDPSSDGTETIIRLSRHNLHRNFEAIVSKAGLVPWDDTFQTLRRSCETELAATNPQHAVSAWIGHSMKVSERHYLQLTDGLYDAATGRATRAAIPAAVSPRTDLIGIENGVGDRRGNETSAHEKTLAITRIPGFSSSEADGARTRNHRIDSRTVNSISRDANSDDVGTYVEAPQATISDAQRSQQHLDPELTEVITHWPILPANVRQEVLALIRSASK